MTIKDLVSARLVGDETPIKIMKPSFVGFDMISGYWYQDMMLRAFNKPIESFLWDQEDGFTVVLSA